MKSFLFLLLCLFSQFIFAEDVYVHGYTRQNGTYVAPYHRTSPNNTVNDNYGTVGNTNPYTGTAGTLPRDNGGWPSTKTDMTIKPVSNPYQGIGRLNN